MILISQVFNHLTIPSLFWRILLVHCLFMFSDVSLRAILFQRNSNAVHVQMHDKKKTFKYFIFPKDPPPPDKKDNQMITKCVNSKQLFKIKAFWRVHGEGTWKESRKYRRLNSASQRERTHFQAQVASLPQFSHVAAVPVGVSPPRSTSIVRNQHWCAEMSIITVSEMAFSSDYWLYSSLKAFLKRRSYWILTSRMTTKEQLQAVSEVLRWSHADSWMVSKSREPNVSRACCLHSCLDGWGQTRMTKSLSSRQFHPHMPRPKLEWNLRNETAKHRGNVPSSDFRICFTERILRET